MIHILCADLFAADQTVYDRLYAKASPERKARVDRCRRQEDKLRCVTAEALLRTALGTDDYRVEIREDGKPRIAEKKNFHFNLSHSGRYVVIAWGGSEVGVDVQQHTAGDRDALARRFFTAQERGYAEGDTDRFYEIWTKKESYLKYTGKGLSGGLGSFNVLDPDPVIRFLCPVMEDGYSLSLCTEETEYTFDLLDVRQLQ